MPSAAGGDWRGAARSPARLPARSPGQSRGVTEVDKPLVWGASEVLWASAAGNHGLGPAGSHASGARTSRPVPEPSGTGGVGPGGTDANPPGVCPARAAASSAVPQWHAGARVHGAVKVIAVPVPGGRERRRVSIALASRGPDLYGEHPVRGGAPGGLGRRLAPWRPAGFAGEGGYRGAPIEVIDVPPSRPRECRVPQGSVLVPAAAAGARSSKGRA